MTVKLGDETDAFEDVIPVEVLGVAGDGRGVSAKRATSKPTAAETPDACRPASCTTFGGLHVELVVHRAGRPRRRRAVSRRVSVRLRRAARLARAGAAAGGRSRRRVHAAGHRSGADARRRCSQTLKELERFQCASGGFAYWPGECCDRVAVPDRVPAARLQGRAGPEVQRRRPMRRAGLRLSRDRAGSRSRRPTRAGGRPTPRGRRSRSRCWSRAAATRTRTSPGSTAIATGCRSSRSRICTTRWSRAAKAAASASHGAASAGSANAVLPEAATAHVEELSDPYLLWFWNSNVRSTAIVLNSLVQGERARRAVSRRWCAGCCQVAQGRPLGQHAGERAALESLVAYYRKFEVDGAELHRGGDARRRASGERAVPGTLDRGEDHRHADGEAARRRRRRERSSR